LINLQKLGIIKQLVPNPDKAEPKIFATKTPKIYLFCPEKPGPLGHACPALRGSEFSGSAWRIAARVWSEQKL